MSLLNSVKTYQLAYPRKPLDTYNPKSSVDWLIKLDPDKEIVKGSLFISGNLYITRDGEPYNADEEVDPAVNEVYYDNFGGWHGLFDTFSTDFDQQNQEEFNNYPAYMRMMYLSSKYRDELSANLEDTIEGRVGHYTITPYILTGEEVGQEGDLGGIPFNVSPYICLNRTSRNVKQSDAPISILVHTRLRAVEDLLFGPDTATGQMSYYITNLQLNWQVQPVSQDSTGALSMGVINNKDFSLNSKVSSIDIDLTQPTQNMVMTLALQDNLISGADPVAEANGLYNNPHATATNFLDCSEVQFFLNDSDNTLLSFKLEDLEEQVMNYKYAMNSDDTSPIDDITLRDGNWSSFALGLNLNGQVPAGTKVSVVINSQDANGPDSNRTWILNAYFKGIVQL